MTAKVPKVKIPKPKVPLEALRTIVDRFQTAKANPKRYGAECFIAKKLYNKYPDLIFWESVPLYRFTLPSLAYFLKNKGKIDLDQKYQLYKLTKREKPPELAAEKLGEDIIIPKRIKTLKDFLS